MRSEFEKRWIVHLQIVNPNDLEDCVTHSSVVYALLTFCMQAVTDGFSDLWAAIIIQWSLIVGDR